MTIDQNPFFRIYGYPKKGVLFYFVRDYLVINYFVRNIRISLLL